MEIGLRSDERAGTMGMARDAQSQWAWKPRWTERAVSCVCSDTTDCGDTAAMRAKQTLSSAPVSV